MSHFLRKSRAKRSVRNFNHKKKKEKRYNHDVNICRIDNHMKNLNYSHKLCKNIFKIKRGTNGSEAIKIIFLFLTV